MKKILAILILLGISAFVYINARAINIRADKTEAKIKILDSTFHAIMHQAKLELARQDSAVSKEMAESKRSRRSNDSLLAKWIFDSKIRRDKADLLTSLWAKKTAHRDSIWEEYENKRNRSNGMVREKQ